MRSVKPELRLNGGQNVSGPAARKLITGCSLVLGFWYSFPSGKITPKIQFIQSWWNRFWIHALYRESKNPFNLFGSEQPLKFSVYIFFSFIKSYNKKKFRKIRKFPKKSKNFFLKILNPYTQFANEQSLILYATGSAFNLISIISSCYSEHVLNDSDSSIVATSFEPVPHNLAHFYDLLCMTHIKHFRLLRNFNEQVKSSNMLTLA